MEARIAKLESGVDHIQADVSEMKGELKEIRREARVDFRLTFGALIGVALGLAGLIAKGFGWLA